jgi:hypothetical protein
MKIGVDLDNTIVDYSEAARVFSSIHGSKDIESLSDLRSLFKDSDNEYWQFIQSWVYTSGLRSAEPSPASLTFLEKAKSLGSELFIVSHKTERTSRRFGDEALRSPALFWLKEKKVVPTLVEARNVFFCETQAEKVEKITKLKLDWFVDDLLEVLGHPRFPSSTARFWYRPTGSSELLPKISPELTVFGRFEEITQLLEDIE